MFALEVVKIRVRCQDADGWLQCFPVILNIIKQHVGTLGGRVGLADVFVNGLVQHFDANVTVLDVVSRRSVRILESNVSFERFVFRRARRGLIKIDALDTVSKDRDVMPLTVNLKPVPLVGGFIGSRTHGRMPVQ